MGDSSMHRQIIILVIVSFLLFGCTSDDKSPTLPHPPHYDYYVDASLGDDSNPGTQSEPFRTITYATSTADTFEHIKVLPGTYDAALGESFPIGLKKGQVLSGDEDLKGDGTSPTEISGLGEFTNGKFASIRGAEGSRISGFKIGEPLTTHQYYAVASDSVTMRISYNTFISDIYAGIYIRYGSTTLVEYNDFGTNSYGVHITDCPDGPVVKFNTFLSSIAIPVNIQVTGTYAVVTDNTITGSGQVGIQFQTGTEALIERNTFDQTTGYSYAAILCRGVAATIRSNTFICDKAIRIDYSGIFDIGTASDPGQNSFALVTGTSIEHNGTETIYAIGNTWPHTPPIAGVDIVVNGTGMVIYGTGMDDHVP